MIQHLCDDLVGEGCYHLQVGLHVGGAELAVNPASVTGRGGGQAWHEPGVTSHVSRVTRVQLCTCALPEVGHGLPGPRAQVHVVLVAWRHVARGGQQPHRGRPHL